MFDGQHNKNMKHPLLIFLLLSLVLTSCKKETAQNKSCDTIKKALLSKDIELMKTEINLICDKIASTPAPVGVQTLEQQQDELVKTLNTCITAVSFCYFCIHTNPGQSEIRITTNGISRTLDISYTSTQKLVFVNMHD